MLIQRGYKTELDPVVRQNIRCDCCGLVINRDLNAAINLENYSTDSSSGTGSDANAFGEGSSGFTHASEVELPSLN